jgi:hypothetical protein
MWLFALASRALNSAFTPLVPYPTTLKVSALRI